jgi:hypothetical protein
MRIILLVKDQVNTYAVNSYSGWFPTEQCYQVLVPASSGAEMPRPWGPYFWTFSRVQAMIWKTYLPIHGPSRLKPVQYNRKKMRTKIDDLSITITVANIVNVEIHPAQKVTYTRTKTGRRGP